MNPLDKIAREVLDMDKKALPSPWNKFKWGDGSQDGTPWSNVSSPEAEVTLVQNTDDASAELIAHYRTSAPEIARAYLREREIRKVMEEALMDRHDFDCGMGSTPERCLACKALAKVAEMEKENV